MLSLRIALAAALILEAAHGQAVYEVELTEVLSSANPIPHDTMSAPGFSGVRHVDQVNPCYPNTLVAKASERSLYSVAGAGLCNMLGNSSYTASRALFRDVVFAGPPGMIQVSLNYEERGALTPGGTGWRCHRVTVAMGAPSTLTTTWPQWQSATVGPACQPNLTTTPQSATSGTFTVPTNTPVGVWIENLCWVSGNEYLWAEVTLPTTGDVFNVPSGITVSSTDAGIVGNTWTGSTVQPHPALVPTPYVPTAGGILTLDLNNGNAGDTGAFAVSQQLQSAQTCFAPLFCVALEQPIPLGQATANATGTASLALPIPVGISPGRYYLQAAWTTGALTGWRSSEVLIIDL